MSITTTGASSQRLNFGNILGGYTHKLYLIWVNRADNLRGTLFGKFNDPYTQGWAASIESSTGYKVFFGNKFSGTDGLWYADFALSTGVQHYAIDYDNSSTSNVPRIFVNNSSKSITAITSPTGSNDEGTGSVTVGDEITADTNYGINGDYLSVAIMNVSGFSTAQIDLLIADAYNSKKATPGGPLIFCPQLWGAAGGVSDGSTLAAGNTIACQVSGALGVPSGSPVLRSDTVLTFQS